jgi:hypothetical protein
MLPPGNPSMILPTDAPTRAQLERLLAALEPASVSIVDDIYAAEFDSVEEPYALRASRSRVSADIVRYGPSMEA